MDLMLKAAPTAAIKQYSRTSVLAIWAAAALPMGALAWIVAPAIAGRAATDQRFAMTLIVALTAGLAWQAVLVLALVAHEQRSLRWSVLREALWLRAPSAANGRRGGRLWLWLIPPIVGFGLLQVVPFGLHGPSSHDFGGFLASDAGQDLLRGNWPLYGLTVAMLVLNTVLGEELLFRGLLLPRMRDAFGRADWLVNGVLFGGYHLHQPWSIPMSVVAGWLFAYPTRRLGSAWLGIITHSVQSVVIGLMMLALVLS